MPSGIFLLCSLLQGTIPTPFSRWAIHCKLITSYRHDVLLHAFKMINPRWVSNNANHSVFNLTQQLIYSILPQQHLSAKRATISLARMED
jgi:hypothetical protein